MIFPKYFIFACSNVLPLKCIMWWKLYHSILKYAKPFKNAPHVIKHTESNPDLSPDSIILNSSTKFSPGFPSAWQRRLTGSHQTTTTSTPCCESEAKAVYVQGPSRPPLGQVTRPRTRITSFLFPGFHSPNVYNRPSRSIDSPAIATAIDKETHGRSRKTDGVIYRLDISRGRAFYSVLCFWKGRCCEKRKNSETLSARCRNESGDFLWFDFNLCFTFNSHVQSEIQQQYRVKILTCNVLKTFFKKAGIIWAT